MLSILRKILFPVVLFAFFPISVLAQNNSIGCSKDGYMVFTVNGIFTDEAGAQHNMSALGNLLGVMHDGEKINIDYLLNPSHLAGLADLFDVAYQKLWEEGNTSDYDLEDMLVGVSEKLHTQKTLFVAHSQGNFYANDLYSSLAGKSGGIPTQSLGVYGVAVPAKTVAGGGMHITSETDQVIVEKVRDFWHQDIATPNANIHFTDGSNGHNFSGVYLKYEGDRIIREIIESLDKLKTNETQDSSLPCVAPPQLGLVHSFGAGYYFVTDRVAVGVVASPGVIMGTTRVAGQYAANVVSGGFSLLESGASIGANGVSGVLTFVDTATKQTGLFLGETTHAVGRYIADASYGVGARLAFMTGSKFNTIADSTSGPSFGPLLPTPPAAASLAGVAAAFPGRPSLSPTPSKPSLVDLNQQLVQARAALEVIAATLPKHIPSAPPSDQGEIAGASTTTRVDSTPAPASDSIKIVAGFMSTEGAPGGVQLPPVSTTLPEATSTIPLASTTPPVIPDTLPPQAPVILSPTSTVLDTTPVLFSGTGEASTSLLVSWNEGPLSIVKVFSVLRPIPSSGDEGEEGAWSASLELPEGTTVVVFVLRDDAGNLSSQVTLTLDVVPPAPLPVTRALSSGDVVINEVSAFPGRQYVELVNRSDATIDLSGAALVLPDVFNALLLFGMIPPEGHFLIAAEDIPGVTEDLVIPSPSWSNLGVADLSLVDLSGTFIDTLPYCADWCGKAGSMQVIERFSTSLPTADYAKNWSAPIDYLTDTPGSGFGTPREQNTLRYLFTLGTSLSESLAPSSATYLINNTLTVESGATLTLSAGTIVEFVGDARLVVLGGLSAGGTAADPVVLRGYASDDSTLAGTVDLLVSGELALLETDLSRGDSVVLSDASTTLAHVSVSQFTNGLLVSGGTVTSTDLAMIDIDGVALMLLDTAASFSSTTITRAGWTGASSIVHVSGGETEISDLTIRVCQPTLSAGIALYDASTTIDGLSINDCGAVGLYAAEGTFATITDATIREPLGVGVVATGGATLSIASTTLEGSMIGLDANTAEVTGEGLSITGNMYGVSDGGQASITIHQSTISGNDTGVSAQSAASVIDMSENYWGSPNGPTLPGQPAGTNGDSVGSNVLVSPYLTADPTLP